MEFIIIGNFVTLDGIAIPGSSIKEANVNLEDLSWAPPPYLRKISISDRGYFIIVLDTSILGVASTVDEILGIIMKIAIDIPEDKYKSYFSSISIINSSIVNDEFAFGGAKFSRPGKQIWVGYLGKLVLTPIDSTAPTNPNIQPTATLPAGVAPSTPPPPPLKPNTKVKITGKVVDTVSKQPLELIIVTNGSDSVNTNKNGEFVFEYIYTPDKGNITFFGVGYTPFSKDISTEQNSKIDLGEIPLEPVQLSVVEIVDKPNVFFINGFVVDNKGKYIPDAKVTFSYFIPINIDVNIPSISTPIPQVNVGLSNVIPLAPSIPPIPIKKIKNTDSKGIFEFGNNSDFNLKDATLTITAPNYEPVIINLTNAPSQGVTIYKNKKNVNSVSTAPDLTQVPYYGKVYPIGRVVLLPKATEPTNEEEIKQKIKRTKDKSDPGFIQRLIQLTVKAYNSAVDRLIPFLLNMLVAFGPAAANAVMTNSKVLDKVCPSQSTINNIIKARNSLVTQINVLYNSLRILSSASSTTSTFTQSLSTAIQAYYLLPIPASTLSAGAVAFLLEAKDTIKEDLKKQTKILDGIVAIISYCAAILAYLLTILNLLDQLILLCAEEQEIPFAQLNPEITDTINNSLNNELVENPPIYKGFKLELVLDATNNTAYPKRYAQALNVQGIAVLKTDSSFASDPQVLIDQLKFIIDSNPNLTAE